MNSPILNGWKQIAEYLQVSVDTAMRWEKELKLPVARKGTTVMALKGEIEKWAAWSEREKCKLKI